VSPFRIWLHVDAAQSKRHDQLVPFANMGEYVLHEVHPISLPC